MHPRSWMRRPSAVPPAAPLPAMLAAERALAGEITAAESRFFAKNAPLPA